MNQNWVPIWPQLEFDQGEEEERQHSRESADEAYAELEIAGVDKSKASRARYRQLRIGQFCEAIDTHYTLANDDENEEMWKSDNMIYNKRRRAMKKDNFSLSEDPTDPQSMTQ